MKLLSYLLPTLLFGAALPLHTQTLRIDPAARLQVIEGWGTSLAWWANIVGTWPQTTVDAVCDDLTSPDELGYNIFRYNIHGGDDPRPHADTTAHHFRWDSGEITSYKPGPEADYDWTANAPQRRVLREILRRNPDAILEAIAYSPPYWMTTSGCSAGAPGGGPNLPVGNEGVFADFLTEVARHYRDTFGISFRTLTGLNEPSESFWKLGGGQEGCHVPAPQQAVLIDSIYQHLKRKGLLDHTGVSASDENKIRETYHTFLSFSPQTRSRLDQVNTHSYFPAALDESPRERVDYIARAAGLRLWQSESGPLSAPPGARTGLPNHLYLAQRIIHDLTKLRPDAWIDWQIASTSPSWGFYTLDTTRQVLVKGKNYFVRKQFSHFVVPGSQLLSLADTSTLAALSPAGDALILVFLNEQDRRVTKTLDVSAFATGAGPTVSYVTDERRDFAPREPPVFRSGRAEIILPPRSVVTLRIGRPSP